MKSLFSMVASLGLVLGVASAAQAQTYKLDPVHSTVIFRIGHLGASYTYGRFNDPTGTVTLDSADPTKAVFAVELAVDKLDTHNEKRDAHLKGPDFFNAAQFPTVAFKSTGVKQAGKAMEVTGDLTLHGVTKSVTVTLEHVGEVKDPWGGTRTGFDGGLTIKRSDFGMTTMIDKVGDEVRLIIGVEAVKE